MQAGQDSLGLSWVFGFSKDLVGGVINLFDAEKKRVFYAAGHVGVIYDVEMHQQQFLQGHCNGITSVAATADKQFIATADAGEDSLIIVWDVARAAPIKSIPRPHPNGVLAMDISPDGMYIATLSNVGPEEEQQVLSLWEWTSDSTEPLYSSPIVAKDTQHCVRFNPSNPRLLVTNGKTRAVFWSSEEGALKFYSPPITAKDFRQNIGDFTRSVFVPNTNLAVTGTVDGDLVLWDQFTNTDKKTKPTDKRPSKIVRVHNSAINVVECIGRYVVTGGAEGFVRFFDFELRIVAWYEDLCGGPVTSVSFDLDEEFIKAEASSIARMVGGDEAFRVPNFIVGTGISLVIAVPYAVFADTNPQNRQGVLIVQGQEGSAQCISCNPLFPFLAASGSSGHVQLWNYERKRLVALSIFENLHSSALVYDPNGKFIAVGFTNGMLKFLDGQTLRELQSFHSKSAITRAIFSRNSEYLAVADSDMCVGLYKFTYRDEIEGRPLEWVYIGRHRSHAKQIVALQFGPEAATTSGVQRLVSVGQDGRIVEYDLPNSHITSGLLIKTYHKIEQLASSTAAVWHPDSTPDSSDVLVANDQYKLRSVGTSDGTTDRVCQGPSFGRPINRLLHVPLSGELSHLVYTTPEKVAGLIKCPVDGNSRKCTGIVAHAGEVVDASVSADGRFVFTCGGTDSLINCWRLNPYVLTDTKLDVDPFVSQLDGGREGQPYKDVLDYFFYAQIRAQGEETTESRAAEGTVPFFEIPNVMRALGYYPKKRDVEDMAYQLRKEGKGDFNQDGEFVAEVDLDTFIKLFVNYRPAIGITKKNLEESFVGLGADPSTTAISRQALFHKLVNLGDAFGVEELEDCVGALLGVSVEEADIPDIFTSKTFAENVLGFQDESST